MTRLEAAIGRLADAVFGPPPPAACGHCEGWGVQQAPVPGVLDTG